MNSNKFATFAFLFLSILICAKCQCPSGDRPFIVSNNSTSDFWIGFAGGASGSCARGCPAGSACNSNNGICFWTLSRPIDNQGSYHLQPNTKATFCLTPPGPSNIWLNGNIFARTGCDSSGGNCLTGNCQVNSDGSCYPGTGGSAPVTLAEFTLALGLDYYDISIINGMNMEVQMEPFGSFNQNNGDPYFCKTPGSHINQGKLTAASWKFNTTVNNQDISSYLNYVSSPNNQRCTRNSDCNGGEVCGLNNALMMVCGRQIGYWTADQVCGVNSNFGYPFNCNTPVPAPYNTLASLYGCSNGCQSCYQPGAGNDCCGCPEWPFPVVGGECHGTNPYWIKYSFPFAKFLKNGCPTCYSFPYDDLSSTFTCSATNKIVGYTISFKNLF